MLKIIYTQDQALTLRPAIMVKMMLENLSLTNKRGFILLQRFTSF